TCRFRKQRRKQVIWIPQTDQQQPQRVATAPCQLPKPVERAAFEPVEAHRCEDRQVIKPAVAILVGGQEESMLVTRSRPPLLILAPERRRERPDVGIRQTRIVTPRQMLANRQQCPPPLLGQGEGVDDEGKDGSVEGEARERVRRCLV